LKTPRLNTPGSTAVELSSEELGLPDVDEGARVALLGGSFNPPHIAHALLAHAALAASDADVVWVSPCASHPFGKDLAAISDRVEMCTLAFRHLGDAVRVVPIEERLPAPSYTVQTLRAVRAARPDLQLRWIAGGDILSELHLWREHEALRDLCEMFIVPRAGHEADGAVGLDFALPEVSSTSIRARLARSETPSGALDGEVLAYIRQHGLYAHSND
jgi:nicotinate-nucleotide adenylyltransferase